MPSEFNFDLTPVEVQVTVNDGETSQKYALREATEAVAAEFRNARIKGARLDGRNVVGLPEDLAGVQSLLVGACLFRYKEDGTPGHIAVGRIVVAGWPARIVKPLFEEAKKISQLDEEEQTLQGLLEQRADVDERIGDLQQAEARAKNLSNGTTGGSD